MLKCAAKSLRLALLHVADRDDFAARISLPAGDVRRFGPVPGTEDCNAQFAAAHVSPLPIHVHVHGHLSLSNIIAGTGAPGLLYSQALAMGGGPSLYAHRYTSREPERIRVRLAVR